MSDPFSDPNASPWSGGWQQPPPPGGDAPRWEGGQQDGASGDPSGAWGQSGGGSEQPGGGWDQSGAGWGQSGGGWGQQPPPPPPQWGQQPDQQWGATGQPGQPGQPGQWGQQPFGQPGFQPQRSGTSTGKVVAIVLGVLGVLVIGIIVAVVVLVNRVGDTVDQVVDEAGGFNFDLGADAQIPDGPRLLETSSTIGAGDAATFEFTVGDSTQVQVDVVGTGGFDPVVALLDGSGSLVEDDDDGGEGFNSRITRQLPSGTYTLEVTEYGDDAGSFQVVVTDL